MTDREVMQQAIEALNLPSMKTQQMLLQRDEAIADLRAQLEQPEQKPVAWMHTTATGHVYYRKKPQDAVFNPQPLYLGKAP